MSCDTKITLVVLVISNILGWIITLVIANKQHKSNMKLANTSFKIELGAKISGKALTLAWKYLRELNKFTAYLPSYRYIMHIPSSPPFSPTLRAQSWIKYIDECLVLWELTQDIFLDMLLYMESHEVVLNQFVESRKVLQTENKKLSELATNYISEINKSKYALMVKPETAIDYEMIKAIEEPFSKKLYDIQGYIYDVQIALQNVYLSDIYGYCVSERKPEDSTVKTLKIEYH